MPANKHWNNFGYENYKFNKKVFNNYCDRDALIWPKCKLFLSMPKAVVSASSCSTPSKKRTRDSFEVDTPEGVVEKSPVKTICLVTSSSEEESENDAVIEAGGGEVEEDDAEKQTGRAMAQARTGRMRLRLPGDADVVSSDSESEVEKDGADKQTITRRPGRMRVRLPEDEGTSDSPSESEVENAVAEKETGDDEGGKEDDAEKETGAGEGGKEDDGEKESGGGEGGKDDDAGDAGEWLGGHIYFSSEKVFLISDWCLIVM